jgi:hypothetical protein
MGAQSGAAPASGRQGGAEALGFDPLEQFHDGTARKALEIAQLGWPVLALRTEQKVPAFKHGLHGATRDPDTIRRWFPPGSRYNLGAVVPEALMVVDIDGPEALARLEGLELDLPATARQQTPRGWHHVYRLPEGVQVRQTVGAIAPGVDTRCAGRGYIVVEPSQNQSGQRWRWEIPPKPDNIAAAPAWLLERLAEAPAPEARPDWSAIAGATAERGCRNQTLASVAGLLFRRLPAGLAYDFATLWASHRTSPPLGDQEIERTLSSVARCELRRRRTGGL